MCLRFQTVILSIEALTTDYAVLQFFFILG
jgi:hypothetical protein